MRRAERAPVRGHGLGLTFHFGFVWFHCLNFTFDSL